MSKKGKKIFVRVLSIILFIVLLPLVVIELIFKLSKKIRRKQRWQKSQLDAHKMLAGSTISEIDLMEGYQFEFFLQVLFFNLGYKVETTKKSKDFGADLILSDTQNGKKIAVQAKRYNKTVGSRAVQEVVAAKQHYLADQAWVVTNNVFSDQAEEVAKEHAVRLIDRTELAELLKIVQQKLNIDGGEENNLKVDFKEKYPFYI